MTDGCPVHRPQLLIRKVSGRRLAPEIEKQTGGRGYPVFSWYSIMAGMGIFPEPQDLRPPTAQEAQFSIEEIDNLLQRSALNFRPHREVLADIPAPRQDRSLQVYFW